MFGKVSPEKLRDKLRGAEKENGCIPFWSWNDRLDRNELEKQAEWFGDSGAAGFFMHARGGLRTEYLSEEWMKCVETCAQKAEQLGIGAWIYDENGWPSGFAGGKVLEKEENRDCFLTSARGAFDPEAEASYVTDGNRLVRVRGGSSGVECLNVYVHVSPSTADILNPRVVDEFIGLTHEAYEKRLGEKFGLIRGFFTDEPQYYRWGVPYSRTMEDFFMREYGEDVADGLGLLFEDADGYAQFRYRYYLAMQSLMLNSFAKKIYFWCDKRGLEFTGHYVEESSLAGQMMCCAGVMPFYKYQHIPGIDWLARSLGNELPLRQIASAAAQYGKQKLLSETFGCCGWDVTPGELRRIGEFQFVGGINVMCQHLIPYSEHGQRKRDYPAHYSPINPWVRESGAFREFNDYFSRLGKLISDSDEVVNTAVLHPIRSAYLNYKRWVNPFEGGNIDETENGLRETMRVLRENGVNYHFVDETLLEEDGEVKNGLLRCGQCEYRYLVIPYGILTVGKNTDRLLREFVSGGGKLLVLGKPGYLEGVPADFSYLKTSTDTAELRGAQACVASAYDTRLHYVVRRTRDKDPLFFVYVQNTDPDESVTVTFLPPEGVNSFDSADLAGISVNPCPLTVTIEPSGSRVLFFSGAPAPEPEEDPDTVMTEPGEFEVVSCGENYLPLDVVRCSTDGINYGEPLNHMGAFDKLLHDGYRGPLWIKYCFEADFVPETVSVIAEAGSTACMTCNGAELKFNNRAWGDPSFLQADLKGLVRRGKNEIVSQIDYFQSDHVYRVLFGENVTESLKNCLSYDSEIEPIYIAGDFGVMSRTGMRAGDSENVVLGDDFYICRRPDRFTDPVTGGYPFFAGKMRLKSEISVRRPEKALLKLRGRWHCASVYVNGNHAGRLLTGDRIDISRWAAPGKNSVEIDTVIGNRNLFGPHHTAGEEEPFGVGPGTFELAGSWKDGKSDRCLNRYALVSPGLFDGKRRI